MDKLQNYLFKRYESSGYETKGKAKVLFYFQAVLLPIVTTHFLVMMLLQANEILSRFSLIMMAIIATIIACLFLIYRGYYLLSSSILLFFMMALIGLNSYNTMLATQSPARFISSQIPLLALIPFGVFFTNRNIFIINTVMIVAIVVFNINSAGEMLHSLEANISIAVTVLSIVLVSVLCLAILYITNKATMLRLKDYEESKSKQFLLNEEMLGSLIDVSRILEESSGEMKINSSGFSENIKIQAESMKGMTATIGDIIAAFDDVTGNINEQNDEVESLILRMGELFQAAQSIQEQISSVSEKIGSISHLAKTGERNMVEMSESMLTISETSNEMTGIINIINDISDRINLLSLNASIEAARAGDAGRGFAVVADEISKLADQTTTSVKEIGAMITKSETEIGRGTANTKHTVSTMGDIMAGINNIEETAVIIGKFLKEHNLANQLVKEQNERVKERLGELTSSTRKQKLAAGEIVNTIDDINELTHQNTAGAEKLLSDSESIARMAADLKQKIGYFDLNKL